MKKPQGWRNESRRHSLASKGVKTAVKGKPLLRTPITVVATDSIIASARKKGYDVEVNQEKGYAVINGEYYNLPTVHDANANPVNRTLLFGGSLYEAGDEVIISQEEPIYDKGNRIDGKKGIILRRIGNEVEIVFDDKTPSTTIMKGLLKAPKGFNKLSSKEMKPSTH